ncbi:putative diacylglycerol O-acyltransferase tgs1 [Rhizina undulata]
MAVGKRARSNDDNHFDTEYPQQKQARPPSAFEDEYHESEEEERPKGVTFFTEDNPPTGMLLGYWKQRKRLFARIDEGIWLTHDAWFEVTPEKVASKIAQHIFSAPSITTVVDAFCGVGGNSIQFALSPKCSKVIAIDRNPIAIQCARHNAKIYGVEDKIEFIVGDFFKLVATEPGKLRTASAVFLSPPWGGPSYKDSEVFDLEMMEPYSGSFIFEQASRVSHNLALYIPRTSDLNQVAKLVPDGQKIQVIHYCTKRKSKALTAYFGELSRSEEDFEENFEEDHF